MHGKSGYMLQLEQIIAQEGTAMTSQTWFITGTSSGFGRHLTEILLARGDRVAATARRPQTLADLAAKYGDQLWTAKLDVSDTAQIREVVDAAFTELGRIDVVVSNAGYGLFGAAEELTDEQITHQINTNLTGSIQLARAVIPHLRAQGGGRIIQLSSQGGQIAFPGLSLYHATKWGIEGFYEPVIGAIDAYADGPVGQVRQYLACGAGTTIPSGDPVKIAQAIIDSAAQEPAPKRLLLGSDAYTNVQAALTGRLASVEAQRELALSTDADDIIAARS